MAFGWMRGETNLGAPSESIIPVWGAVVVFFAVVFFAVAEGEINVSKVLSGV